VSLRFAGAVRQGVFVLEADVSVEPGEVVALLGPNGAGKSTLLRAVAGLRGVDAGTVTLEQDVLDDAGGSFVPAERRSIGVVFQDHRLFPHLRVVDNVAFGLRSKGIPRATARARAQDRLDRLGLADHAEKRPRELSGGQAQRVALARALAGSPRALLLDEPLAALDVQTRAAVQGELRDHLDGFGGPTLLVTHDPIEALLLADRIVVLEGGRVAQAGTPAEITSRPTTEYVARLVGMNLYSGTAVGTTVALDGGGMLSIAEQHYGPVLVAARPSTLTVHTEQPHGSSARNVWAGTVASLAPLGDRIRLSVTGPPDAFVDVTAVAVAELRLAPGRPVWLSAKATELVSYPAAAGDSAGPAAAGDSAGPAAAGDSAGPAP
jgi:molybdate transport system ATP-binding protein